MDSSDALSRSRCRERRLNNNGCNSKIPKYHDYDNDNERYFLYTDFLLFLVRVEI